MCVCGGGGKNNNIEKGVSKKWNGKGSAKKIKYGSGVNKIFHYAPPQDLKWNSSDFTCTVWYSFLILKVLVTKWNDNKPVSVMSNHGSVTPLQSARRWSAKDKAYINVPMPNIIGHYNKHMGGVDLVDRWAIKTVTSYIIWYMTSL